MDTVSIQLDTKKASPEVVVVVETSDEVKVAVTAIPTDEWAERRKEVMAHYDIEHSTRIDCTNIITALTLALENK